MRWRASWNVPFSERINTGAADTTVGKAWQSDPNVATMYQQLADDHSNTAAAGCVTGAFPTVRGTVIGAFSKGIESADVPMSDGQPCTDR